MSTANKTLRRTQETRNFDDLRQLPLSLRKFFSSKKGNFDKLYDNRKTSDWLQRFMVSKYPILDRDYGSPNEDICNIFFNVINDKETQDLIDQMTFDREWVFHPIRKFDKWNTISKYYYNDENLFWIIIVFNRIADPFTALTDFNIVRIPNISFLYRMPYRTEFDFNGGILS